MRELSGAPASVTCDLAVQVTYSLDRDSDEYQLFSIESGTGRISTRVILDREDAARPSPFYTVTVFAEDGAPSDISPDGGHNKGTCFNVA